MGRYLWAALSLACCLSGAASQSAPKPPRADIYRAGREAAPDRVSVRAPAGTLVAASCCRDLHSDEPRPGSDGRLDATEGFESADWDDGQGILVQAPFDPRRTPPSSPWGDSRRGIAVRFIH